MKPLISCIAVLFLVASTTLWAEPAPKHGNAFTIDATSPLDKQTQPICKWAVSLLDARQRETHHYDYQPSHLHPICVRIPSREYCRVEDRRSPIEVDPCLRNP